MRHQVSPLYSCAKANEKKRVKEETISKKSNKHAIYFPNEPFRVENVTKYKINKDYYNYHPP